MEVTLYEVIPECYPRFKNADKRICDITERTNKLLLDTFVPTLVRETFPTRNICHNVKLYLCKMEEDKMNLNVENFVMKNESYTSKQTHIYRNAGQFLTENKNSFDSFTVFVFQAYQDLGHELEKFLPPGPSVIIVTCLKEGQDAENQYDHLNCKTVSSEENIAEVIGSLLEQMAFKPMKEMFEYIRGLCYENHSSSSIVTKLDRSEPEQMQDANGSFSYDEKNEKLEPEQMKDANGSFSYDEKDEKLEPEQMQDANGSFSYDEKDEKLEPEQMKDTNGSFSYDEKVEKLEPEQMQDANGSFSYDEKDEKLEPEQMKDANGSFSYDEKDEKLGPEQMKDANGSFSYDEKDEKFVAKLSKSSNEQKRKLPRSTKKGTCTTSRQELNELVKECNETEENEIAKQEVAKLSNSTNDSHNKKRKLQRSTKNRTCTTSIQKLNGLARECNEIEENEIAKWEELSNSMNVSHNGKGKLQASTETGTCTCSSEGSRKLNGHDRECKEIEKNEITKREVSKLSSSTNDSHNERRKLQACLETGTCVPSSDDSRKLNECFNSDEKSQGQKFRENKIGFQRLLGEMIGMYRRSRLPEILKPQLDGPWGKVSDQVIKSLYELSPSVRGYSYKFITRLQIHVFGKDIEKLRPKIAEILNNHGIKSDSYDIVPPLDDVKQFSKILSGSKVERDEDTPFGSLTSFVKMTPKTQKEKTYCSLASKHVLQGQKTIAIVTNKRTIKADVIEKTAPLDDVNMMFDIAAARIKKEDELHCDGRFKTEDGKLMKGIMNKNDSIDCLHVHMNGAITPNSRGIIATTQYINRNSSVNGEESQPEAVEDDINEVNRFIYVESRDKTKPFCEPGDSGAMVCADHEEGYHVELISSVIGGPLIVKNKDGKDMITDSYQTLRLTSGVDYLEKLTQSDIEFFDS